MLRLLTGILGAAALAAACSSGQTRQSAESATGAAGSAPTAKEVAGVPEEDAAPALASLLIFHFPGDDAEATAAFLEEVKPAGIILMGDNIPDPESDLAEQTRQWQQVARDAELPDFLIAIDQEGGTVTRLSADPAPAPSELIGTEPREVEEAYSVRGEYLATLGINVNFGIVADTTDNPDSFIYDRVLGYSPQEAAAAVEAAVRGETEGSVGQVASTIKHFPGHGMTDGDSHQVITDCGDTTFEQWQEGAAQPFEAGVAAGATLVMMSHVVCRAESDEPASLSPAWYNVLREDVGFTGPVVTDDMSMLIDTGDPEYADPVENAVRAINAGADLVISISGDDAEVATADAKALISGLEEALVGGRLDETRVREALARGNELRSELTAAAA